MVRLSRLALDSCTGCDARCPNTALARERGGRRVGLGLLKLLNGQLFLERKDVQCEQCDREKNMKKGEEEEYKESLKMLEYSIRHVETLK